MIRVAYVGNFRHAFCTEAYVARALEREGCRVERIQQDEITHRAVRFIEATLPNVDLVLYTRTHNTTALGAEWNLIWAACAHDGRPTASLHLDRFWDLEREHLIHDGDPLFRTAHVFTADGGNDDRFAAAGVNHHWMQPAIDRDEALREPRAAVLDVPPIVFVGSALYHSEYPERDDLIRFLTDRYGDLFAHYGRGGRPVIREQGLTDVYRTARVVVGDSCFANSATVPHGEYWSDRIPETVGRGGLLLHPYVDGMALAGWPGQFDVYPAGDWEALARRIEYHIANGSYAPAECRDWVLAHHTWDNRVREILATVGLTEREAMP